MKRNSKAFYLITLAAIIVLYLVSSILTLGTAFAPATAVEIISSNPDKDKTVNNAYVAVDIDRKKPIDKEATSFQTANISAIYVYVGEIRTWSLDENGNAYAEMRFQFKTRSDKDSGKFYREEVVKIPVRHNSGGYEWIKVFDANLDAGGEITYSRVKISIPDSLDLYEVVFTDATGYALPLSKTGETADKIADSQLVIDEQDTFTTSTSKKYHFTDSELKNLASANSLRGGRMVVGDGPLSTVISFVGISIFGVNTFGLRVFDCLAGLGMIILAYVFALKTFGGEKHGALSAVSALTLGAIFTASNFALGTVGAFFGVLSLYLASRYFVKHFYLDDLKGGVLQLGLIGVFYGLAVACDFAYSLLLVGHIAMFVASRRRAYKQYKRDEKEAKGLDKEEVFLSYRKKSLISLGVFALSVVAFPIALFTLAYIPCAGAYKTYYGLGFVASAVKHFTASITPSYQSFPLALFAGFGGLKLNGYYSFLNYFTSIFALLCFVFVTFVVFGGKKVKYFKNVGIIANKYKITTIAFVSMALPVLLGLTSTPYGFAGVSVFYCAYVAFAYSILARCFKRKIIDIAFNVATIIGIILFGLAYVGFVGITVSQTASNILYIWQVL